MAARVSIPPSPAAEKSPDTTSQKRGCAALRLELEADTDEARRASLSHELARIHELGDDLAAAARDALAATNYAAGFVEPLEALIAIAHRRRSRSNLEKLLERLFRVAQTEPERLRAGLELFAHLLVGKDFTRAEQILEALDQDQRESPLLWLARQVLASHQGSASALLGALEGRTSAARSNAYRAELLERAALRTITSGRIDEGLAQLRHAYDESPTFQRLRLLERQAARAERYEEARACADDLTEMLTRALQDTEEARASEVPGAELNEQGRDAARLRQVIYTARAREFVDGARLAELLQKSAPDDWLVLGLVRALGLRAGASAQARLEQERELLRAALDQAQPNPLDVGGLHLTLALSAEALGNEDAAQAHFTQCAELFPTAFVPQARLLGRAAERNSPASVARAWASMRASMPVHLGPALLTAAALLSAGSDPGQALRYLEAGREAGHNSRERRRFLRVVALLSGSNDLVLAADLTLLDADAPSPVLAWEAARLAFLAGKGEALERALRPQATARVARLLLQSFLIADEQDPNEAATESSGRRRKQALLDALREHESSSPLGRALGLVQAARDARAVDESTRTAALTRLQAFAANTPTDSVAAAALIQLTSEQDLAQAARHLLRAAEATDDAELGRAWAARSALFFLQAGRTNEALRALDHSPPGEASVLGLAEHYVLGALGSQAQARRDLLRRAAASLGHSTALLELSCEALVKGQTDAWELAHRALDAALLPAADPIADHAPTAVLAWHALLLATSRGPTELEELIEKIPESVVAADELAFLRLAAELRANDAMRQADCAQRLLEASLRLHDPHSQSTLDSSLLASVLCSRAGAPFDQAQAGLALSTALGDGCLEAHARLLAQRALGGEANQDAPQALYALAQAQPASPEIAWAALEAQDISPSDARARLLEQLRGALATADANDPDVAMLDLMRAFDRLLGGDDEQALADFLVLAEQAPGDPTILFGLLTVARRLGRAEPEVLALIALAQKCNDDARAAVLWERAGDLQEGILGRTADAESSYCAALGRAPERVSTFARVYKLAKKRDDKPRLVELIDARLDVARDSAARVELLWEKSRLCRALGRRASALRALDLLLDIQPGHLPALALAAEMHLVDERFERAADSLRTIAEHPDTPAAPRAQAGLHASDLFERLHRPREAVALLQVLERYGVDRGALLERRARTAARAGAWDVAYAAFRELNDTTAEPELRRQGARMMLAIQRDHLRAPGALEDAAKRVLADAPLDPDAVDVVLTGDLPDVEKQNLLTGPIEEARAALVQQPLSAGHISRLAALSEAGRQARLVRLTLGTLHLTGASNEERRHIFSGDDAWEPTDEHELTVEDLDSVAAPGELGAPGVLARLVAPFVARLTEPDLKELGVSTLHRVDPFTNHPARLEIARFAKMLGLVEFELYIGGNDPERLIAFEREFPTLIVGQDVVFPLGARDRARLSIALYGAARGLGAFLNLPAVDARLWLTALLVALGRPGDLPSSQEIEERAQALGQVLPRETRDELQAQVNAIIEAGGDPLGLAWSARISAARLATFIHGDPSIVRSLPRLVPEEAEGRRQLLSEVIRFAFSKEFESLRRKVGFDPT